MKKHVLLGFSFFFTLLSYSLVAQISQQQVNNLDKYIEKAVMDWEVPGIAVVVCKGDKVLLQKGYGIREKGKTEKVDTQTIFACASTTKAMTAVAMGMLVDDGLIRWNDKVIQHFPEFKLADAYLTRELTIRDLLTHNAGMGNTDFLWGHTDNNQNDILEKFSKIPPTYSMRSSFIYQNIMYLIAGKVIEHVSGMPWREFVKKRIFTPLSMTHTFPTFTTSKSEQNRSTPHDRINNVIIPIKDTNADAIDAAGSVWSCAEDISKWMRFMLDTARVNGKKLLSESNWAEVFKPQAVVSLSGFYPTAQLTKPNWMTYGLGWFQHDYKGKMVQFHTGSLAGTVAIHGLIPSEKIGVYVFGNLDHTEVRHAIMYRVFDLLLGEKERDWSMDFKQLYDSLTVQNEQIQNLRFSQRVPDTKPTLTLEQYAGTYIDPYYGKIEIVLENGQLVIRWSSQLHMTLEHWHYDTFKGTHNKSWIRPDLVTFELNESGKVAKILSGSLTFIKK